MTDELMHASEPAITGDDADRQLQQLERWFNDYYPEISDELYLQVRADQFESVLCRLATDLQKCRAKSRTQFLSWVSRQARKCAEEYANDTRHFNDNVNLQEVLAASRPERKNTKQLIYEQHGDKVFIQLSHLGKPLVWIIPTEWFPVAKRLWPVHVRLYPQSGPYIAKKVPRLRPDGKREQVTVPLHRLFVDCGGQSLVGDHAAQSVFARNGNYLDWTGGNLGPLNPTTSRDLMDVGTRSDFNEIEELYTNSRKRWQQKFPS